MRRREDPERRSSALSRLGVPGMRAARIPSVALDEMILDRSGVAHELAAMSEVVLRIYRIVLS